MASASSSGYVLQPGQVNPSLAKNSSFVDTFRPAAPDDLFYNDIMMKPAGARDWKETNIENGQVFNPSGEKFTVQLKSRAVGDFRYASLNFRARCWAEDNSPVFFQNGIATMIERIRVLLDGKLISEQIEKNTFQSMNYAFSRAPNYDSTVGRSLHGIGSVAQRKIWRNGKTYSIPLNIPLLTSEEQIMANHTGFTVEFYMATPNKCMCYDTTTTPGTKLDYEIKWPRIRYHEVKYQKDLQESLLAISPVYYPFTDYKYFPAQIQAGATQFQYTIPIKVQAIQAIIMFMRNNEDMNNPAQLDVLTQKFEHNKLLSYQLRVDNDFHPPQAISAGGDTGPEPAYTEAMICMDKSELASTDAHTKQNNGCTVMPQINCFVPDMDAFTVDKFLACIDLRQTTDNNPNYINPFDSRPGNVTLIADLRFEQGFPAKNTTLHIFVLHTTVVSIDNEGNCSKTE